MELPSVGSGTSSPLARYLVSRFKGVNECRNNVTSKNSKAANVANNRVAVARSPASSNDSPSRSPVSSPEAKRIAAPKVWAAARLRLSE
jgi:hypothetical protein